MQGSAMASKSLLTLFQQSAAASSQSVNCHVMSLHHCIHCFDSVVRLLDVMSLTWMSSRPPTVTLTKVFFLVSAHCLIGFLVLLLFPWVSITCKQPLTYFWHSSKVQPVWNWLLGVSYLSIKTRKRKVNYLESLWHVRGMYASENCLHGDRRQNNSQRLNYTPWKPTKLYDVYYEYPQKIVL